MVRARMRARVRVRLLGYIRWKMDNPSHPSLSATRDGHAAATSQRNITLFFCPGNSGRLPATQRRRHPEKATYLTADNQMAPKPNLPLNAEIESSGRAANGSGNN